MSYQVLARKWRPTRFEDVVGQAHVVAALSNALDQDRVHHAFLFTGTRGVGKTTLARIFARALNCEKGVSSTPCGSCAACEAITQGRFVDLIEVDAASRTRVDDTRELLENVQYAPTQGRYKVYLIDEVHMLSAHSFNALLKTLEEPPEHVKFLLATTDPQKLPVTVLSRCIQFSLNAIEQPAIEMQLSKILASESLQFEANALVLLARAADGSLRDALSLLDQAIAYSDRQLTETSIRQMLGLVDGQVIINILDALANDDATLLMQNSDQLTLAAQDLGTVLDDLLSYMHALALYQFSPEAIEWKGLDEEHIARLAQLFSPEVLQLYYQITLNGKRDFSLAPDPRTGFEMVLLRLLAFRPGQTRPPGTHEIDTTNPGLRGNVDQVSPEPLVAVPPENPVAETALKPAANLAEDQQFFLENGLNNTQLTAHIKPASQLSGASTSATAEVVPDEASNQLRAQSSYLPGEMMDLTSLVDNISVWSDFVVKVGLRGMARQLVVHMTPIHFDNGVLNLKLDEQYASFMSADRIRQISDALQRGSGQTFEIKVEIGAVQREKTASGVIAERERSNLEKMRSDFKQDDNVQELVSVFDAEIDESSIKSVN